MTWQAATCNADPEEVRRALSDSGVAVIPDAGFDDDAFVAFLESLGPITFTDGETPLPGQPKLNVVSNRNRSKPPRSVFHSDTSYVAAPPAYTALRAVEVPERGGETVFTNQFLSFERLSGEDKAALAGARVLHRVTGVQPGEGAETETWHPLFRRHPVSGKTALFLSTPERCVDLCLSDGTHAPTRIEDLYAHSTDPAHEWRHQWRPGDMVIWDNRCTLHKGDHSDVSGPRVLHRGMVAGEPPIPA